MSTIMTSYRRARIIVPVAATLIAALGVATGSNMVANAQSASVSIAVPAYFKDDALWTKAIDTPAVGWIIGHPDTPSNGKFVAEKELAANLAKAKAKGKKTLVYVTAGYDKEGWQSVADKAESALAAYPEADGVFLDEILYNECAKYSSLSKGSGGLKGVRDRNPGKLVVLNPGAPMLKCYEGLADGYLNLERAEKDIPAWLDNVNQSGNIPEYSWMFQAGRRSQIWQMVHSVPASKMATAVDEALSRNASVLFLTPDVLPNPYDKLPDDASWSAMINRVEDYRSGKVALPALKGVPVNVPISKAADTTPTTVKGAAPTTTKKPGTKKTVPKKKTVTKKK
jgi:Spherulation-specific family 4